jgi:hypothetical protein
MYFVRTNIPPNINSRVTVTFAGLMLLRAAAGNTLEIDIHKFSRIHLFQVLLVVNKPQRPPRLIRLLTGPLTSNFDMRVLPEPTTHIQAFAPTPDPFHPQANNDELDYRWSFNFRSLPGHQNVDTNDGANPVATLNAGVLYTQNLTRLGLEPVQVCGLTETRLYRVAADQAAAVDLPTGYKLTLSWQDLGQPQTQDLPRPNDPTGTTYTVALLNEPAASDPPAHDELREYYRVLQRGGQPVPDPQQCRLEFRNLQKTDEIPCLHVFLEP